MDPELEKSVDAVLARRHDNGDDYWATPDRRLAVGSPFSTLEALQVLHELGVPQDHEAVAGAVDLLLDARRDDGRFRLAPKGALYPCHTANVARVLCRFGYAGGERLRGTFEHLLEIQHEDGGWRCNKAPLGRSPHQDASNPGVTLFVLDAFRYRNGAGDRPALERAVENLLEHWRVRRPMGPCSFGIGTLFHQVEYPFLRYNLFSYVHVLSFYAHARRDERFREAFAILESKLVDGALVVERPNRRLAKLAGFVKGRPSAPATARFREILENLAA